MLVPAFVACDRKKDVKAVKARTPFYGVVVVYAIRDIVTHSAFSIQFINPKSYKIRSITGKLGKNPNALGFEIEPRIRKGYLHNGC